MCVCVSVSYGGSSNEKGSNALPVCRKLDTYVCKRDVCFCVFVCVCVRACVCVSHDSPFVSGVLVCCERDIN